jgi:hypothetical protein
MSWESQVIALLSASIVRPFVLAAAGWLTPRLFRVRHPASRHAVWTAVLAGMLLLPFVSVLTPHWTVAVLPRNVPVLPSPVLPSPVPPRNAPSPKYESTAAPMSTPPEPLPLVRSRARQQALIQHPVLWLYFAGLLAMAAYRLAG